MHGLKIGGGENELLSSALGFGFCGNGKIFSQIENKNKLNVVSYF